MNVLITGANSGFGLLTMRTFADHGHTVYAGYRTEGRSGDLLKLAREEPRVKAVRLDVTEQASIDAALASAGEVDVLVNNAGFEVAGPVDSLSDATLMKQFDTNVFGVLRMIRAVTPGMRQRGRGAIVNLSSVVGWLTVPYAAAYSASKHAVESFSEALWFEMAPFGIRVAVVEPGGFATNFGENIYTEPTHKEGSPHWAHAQRFSGAVRKLIDGGAAQNDPQEVADLIYEAATTDAPKFRYVAGADARAFIPFYKSQEFEGFREGILGQLGLNDWGKAA